MRELNIERDVTLESNSTEPPPLTISAGYELEEKQQETYLPFGILTLIYVAASHSQDQYAMKCINTNQVHE